jgi:DNA-binding beta-propeller fold protein YncE
VAVSPDGKSVYVASPASHAVARFKRNTTTGAITQPAGKAGCVSEDGSGPCADGHGLSAARSVAVSADGKSVYLAGVGGVARFKRDTTTGALTQPFGSAGCVGGSGVHCADGRGLDEPWSVAVSPDGKSVYVASDDPDRTYNGEVARLNRDTTTGALTQPAGSAGCVSETGETSSGPCADGHGLTSPYSVAVSPDGKSVYVASTFPSDAVVRLNRNTTTGAITQPAGTAGCVSEDGSGPCADGHALIYVFGVAVSPDGKNVYAASSSSEAVARFNRNTTSGAITQPAGTAGCVGSGSVGCADGHGLSGARSVAVSPDGKSVYVASWYQDAVARLNRDP